MEPDVRAAIEGFFQTERPELAHAVTRIRALDDAPTYDDATTAQLLHGFTVIIHEALEGSTREARDLYNAAAVDLVQGQGRTVGSLAKSFVIAGAVLAVELERAVDMDARVAATDWLAGFFGDWAAEIVNGAAT